MEVLVEDVEKDFAEGERKLVGAGLFQGVASVKVGAHSEIQCPKRWQLVDPNASIRETCM